MAIGKISLFFSVLLFFFATESFAQVSHAPEELIGEIITNSQANALFGPVLKTFKFKKITLRSYGQLAPDYLLFQIKNDKLKIANKKKEGIYPKGGVGSASDVYHVFSTSLVMEICNLMATNDVEFEMRANNIFTISVYPSTEGENEGYTLEYAKLCPPFCIPD